MSFETISVIGLGYIGLPTAAMFASRKKRVIGVDVNRHAVNTINKGEIHIVEPDLDMIVHAAVSEGYLKAVMVPEPADAFLIAVPTPFKSDAEQKNIPDLRFIKAATKAISSVIKKGDLIILESTSPVGTTEKMVEWLSESRPDLTFPNNLSESADVNVAYCPERVLPGQVVKELVENDRVIGGISRECSLRAIQLYSAFVKGECVITNARTAEMAKLTENSCRDVQIAFANELSVVCDKLNINVWELIELSNRHPRINILRPGPGVGGHCIAVDPWFIVSEVPKEARLIRLAREINDNKPGWVIEKVKVAIAECLINEPEKTSGDIKVACYGLSFKPNIDDLRESPALSIAQELVSIHSGSVFVVEPNIKLNKFHDKLNLIELDEALQFADIHVFLVKHNEFTKIKKPDGIVIDTVGIW